MKILFTAILLFTTLLVVPLCSFYFGKAPGPAEWDVLYRLIKIATTATLVCFVVGELTGNNSQVDKTWSLLPVAYTWIVADTGGYSLRLVIMAILVTIWGIRLTINFALKGAFRWKFWAGEEDYRWQVLRQKPAFNSRWKWTLFNLLFICCYQNLLILAFTLPAVVAMQFNSTPLNTGDFISAGLLLFFIAFETVADIQQWKFQSKKWSLLKAGQPLNTEYQAGFLSKGLWAYCRHPNYFAEQSVWICFYCFSVAAGAGRINWSIAGCLLLVLLFQGSAAFSEEISATKYPGYKNYQLQVNKFIPMPRKK
jgi:steroid 5-alpha reductase family enzyme